MLRAGVLTLLLTTLPVAAAGEDPPSVPEIVQHAFTVVTVDGDTGLR